MARPTDIIIQLRPTKLSDETVNQILKSLHSLPVGAVRGVKVVDQSQFLVIQDIAPMYEREGAGCPPF
jgi:hypothetical protein